MKAALPRFRNMSIVSKMVLSYVLAGLVPIIIAAFVFYGAVSRNLTEHLENMSASMNEAMVSELNMVVSSYKTASSSIFVDRTVFSLADGEALSATELVARESDLKRILFRLTVLHPSIEAVSILGKDNLLVSTGQKGIQVSRNGLLEKTWIRQIEEQPENFYIIPLHRNDTFNRFRDGSSITFVRKIMTSGKKYAGALLIDVDLGEIFASTSRIHSDMLKRGLEICITDREGLVLYDSRLVSAGPLEEDFPVMVPFTDAYQVAEGKADLFGLTVYTAFPRADFQLNRQRYIGVAFFFICMTAILTAVLTQILYHSFVKPILAVSRGMEKAGRGEYEPLENTDYSGEVGTLTRGYNRMIVDMQEMIDRVYVFQLSEKQAQLAALHTQINPHMLFNTLEAIRMKAILAGVPEVAYTIKILAKMYRTVLDTSNRDHTIAGEIEYAKAFLTLQNTLTGEGSYLLLPEVPDDLLKMSSIPALFEPLVENSIRHASRGEDTTMYIRIDGKVSEDGKSAIFTVTDDGTGMEAEQLEALRERMEKIREKPDAMQGDEELSGKHIGLRNILKRLRLKYGDAADMRILYSDGTGTSIEIRLPFEEKPEGSENG